MNIEKNRSSGHPDSLTGLRIVRGMLDVAMAMPVLIAPEFHHERERVHGEILELEAQEQEPPEPKDPPRRPNAPLGRLALGNI